MDDPFAPVGEERPEAVDIPAVPIQPFKKESDPKFEENPEEKTRKGQIRENSSSRPDTSDIYTDERDGSTVRDIEAATSRSYREPNGRELLLTDFKTAEDKKSLLPMPKRQPSMLSFAYIKEGYILTPIFIFLVVFVLILTFVVGYKEGEPALGWIALLALVPAACALFFFYWYRAPDSAPWHAIFGAFILGVIGALPAALLEWGVGSAISPNRANALVSHVLLQYLWNYVGVALVEESAKALVVAIMRKRSTVYYSPVGAVLYGMAGALGFATLENLKYVTAPKRVSSQLSVALRRAVSAVPSHAAWGSIIGVSIARRDFGGEDCSWGKALLVPVVLHGTYDFLLSLPLTTVGQWIAFAGACVIVVTGLLYLYQQYRQAIPSLELMVEERRSGRRSV